MVRHAYVFQPSRFARLRVRIQPPSKAGKVQRPLRTVKSGIPTGGLPAAIGPLLTARTVLLVPPQRARGWRRASLFPGEPELCSGCRLPPHVRELVLRVLLLLPLGLACAACCWSRVCRLLLVSLFRLLVSLCRLLLVSLCRWCRWCRCRRRWRRLWPRSPRTGLEADRRTCLRPCRVAGRTWCKWRCPRLLLVLLLVLL